MKLRARTTLVLGTSLLVLAALTVPAQAGVAIPSDVPNLGLYFVDNFQLGSMPSQIFGKGADQNDSTAFLMCKSNTDDYCMKASGIFANINLDICNERSQTSCIANVWAIDPNGKKIPGTVSKIVQEMPLRRLHLTALSGVEVARRTGRSSESRAIHI